MAINIRARPSLALQELFKCAINLRDSVKAGNCLGVSVVGEDENYKASKRRHLYTTTRKPDK